MSRTVNKVILIGRMGRNPETRFMQDGKAITSFTIATNEYGGKDETGKSKEVAEWHFCKCFGKSAEIATEYLHKGNLVYVEGKIITRSWTDKEGNTRSQKEIFVDRFNNLSPRSENGQKAKEEAPDNPDNVDENDIPF